jgi:hypothetical protein
VLLMGNRRNGTSHYVIAQGVGVMTAQTDPCISCSPPGTTARIRAARESVVAC